MAEQQKKQIRSKKPGGVEQGGVGTSIFHRGVKG